MKDKIICEINGCDKLADSKIIYTDGSSAFYCLEHLAYVETLTPAHDIESTEDV